MGAREVCCPAGIQARSQILCRTSHCLVTHSPMGKGWLFCPPDVLEG